MKKLVLMLFLSIGALIGCSDHARISPESSAYGYWSVIEEMYEGGGYDEFVYVAFAYEGIDPVVEEELVLLARDFCQSERKQYLEGNIDDLMAEGYITTGEVDGDPFPIGFTNGVLITIESATATTTEIVGEVDLWCGSLGARGASFTTVMTDGTWEVTLIDQWVS